MNPTLVILAAGIGKRYGGLKQMDRVGPSGETIVDYSVYDALRAGFGKVIFVIRRDIKKDFKVVFGRPLEKQIEVGYVFQELEDIPAGLSVPAGRKKPWGTAQAVLASEVKVREPFAVLNADDFYGFEAFKITADFLGKVGAETALFSLVGYRLGSTLSAHGAVARGVCEEGRKGMLKSIVERTHIEQETGRIFFSDEKGRMHQLTGRETVSMNFWGFTPKFFEFARIEFEQFVRQNLAKPKAELYIPSVVNKIVEREEASVRILRSRQSWFGVTYREDKPAVVASLKKLVEKGVYPKKLWP
jgi:hypothetical protein